MKRLIVQIDEVQDPAEARALVEPGDEAHRQCGRF